MTWEDYKCTYWEACEGLELSHLAAAVASDVLSDFPSRLPKDVKAELTTTWQAIANALLSAAQAAKAVEAGSNQSEAKGKEWTVEVPEGSFGRSAFLVMVARSAAGKAMDFPDFRLVFLRQCVIAVVAQVEAFLNDTLRAIAMQVPQMLARNFTVPWKTIMSASTLESLQQQLAEELVRKEFSGRSIRERALLLAERYGITIGDTGALEHLSLCEEVRHILVHRGGKIDDKFIHQTKSTLPRGSEYPLDQEFVDRTTKAAYQVLRAVYETVSIKHFGIPSDQLRRSGP